MSHMFEAMIKNWKVPDVETAGMYLSCVEVA